MISSDRSQNVIVSFVIIAALVSSVFLVSNAQYYSGSYILAGRMEVIIVNTVVSNVDPTNESIFPGLSFTFNFRTDSPTEGNVKLTYIGASVTLNGDQLSFTVLNAYLNNHPNQVLHPEYNANFTLGNSVNSIADRAAILLADSIDTWSWFIRLDYDFITFDKFDSVARRTLFFNWTGSTTVIYA